MRSAPKPPFCRGGAWPAIAILLIALFELAPRTARAQQAPELIIRWEAPAHCPQQEEVRERVRKLSGSLTSLQGDLQADGTITRVDSGRYHLRLVMHSGALVGERNIDSQSCTDLTRAAAVAIALLLRSGEPLGEADLGGEHAASDTGENAKPGNTPGAEDRQQPGTKPTVSEPATPTQAPGGERSKPSPAASSRNWHARLQAPLAALSIGPLPKPSWGIAFAAGASYQNWSLWLGGALWQQQNVPASDFPGYSANVGRARASLGACRALPFSVFEVAPCLVLSAERMTATGAGPNVAPESQHNLLLAPGVGVQGRVYLTSWFSLGLSVDGEVEALRPRLYIGGVGAVRQVGPAQFAVSVGPEWIL